MKELTYFAITVAIFSLVFAWDKIKPLFSKNKDNYRIKKAVTGTVYWMPVNKNPNPKPYPHPYQDFLSEWIDSLEASTSPSGEIFYLVTNEDIAKLKEIINHKYGYIIE